MSTQYQLQNPDTAVFNLNTQEYINPLYQPQKYMHTIFDPKLKDRKSQSVSKIVTAGQPQLFKYSEAQLENFYAHKKNKQDNIIGKFQDDQYLKKQNENLDYTQKIQKQFKLPDYPDQGYIHKAYQDEQKEYQNQQKRQLGKLLVWTNNNSLLQTHVSKTMTLGRNTKDYINWTKAQGKDFSRKWRKNIHCK
ncbi:hypothetical protein PPERSA_04290 [Pseudocohnilembus persalinus]|uniref:Uncharacterized protein n=1 Tax=Pseudocohnilembus persalinus TaxID=266149 RepID=A0A0V0QNF6_PSEPJ|nr:hypothetical protein PPERSA_04290 [Pseudocohnilembus persalinus]|eukprot:KRX03782.1 hypothetical protein PPERSA_04290 [Pseudocohnilembus persalinus]